MLAITSLNNQESTVYTVPTGKSAMIYVDINPMSSEPSCTIKINGTVYWSGTLYGFLSAKLALTSGDIVRVGTDGQLNIFVHGLEV